MKRLTVIAVLLLVSNLSFAERYERSATDRAQERATACAAAKGKALEAAHSAAYSDLSLEDRTSVSLGYKKIKKDEYVGACSCDEKDSIGYYTCTADAAVVTKKIKKDRYFLVYIHSSHFGGCDGGVCDSKKRYCHV